MRNISNTTGSNSGSQASGEDGDIAAVYSDIGETSKDLIHQANSVSILNLFKYYNLNINKYNRKIRCPFPSHKGGKEATPSFQYYPETNSFYCFGCKTKSKCCDFVAAMDKTTKLKAANKILQLFDPDFVNDQYDDESGFFPKFDIIIDFSNCIREFMQMYKDEKSLKFIENICFVYDSLNLKHKLDTNGQRSIIETLKKEILNYKV